MEESKQILMAVTELQANMKNMSEQLKDISKIGHAVIETTQSVKSAHMRIDDLKTDFALKILAQKEDSEKKLTDAQKEREKEVGRVEKDLKEKIAKTEKDADEKIQAECKAREKMEGHITWLWRSIGIGGIGTAFWLLQQAFNFGG